MTGTATSGLSWFDTEGGSPGGLKLALPGITPVAEAGIDLVRPGDMCRPAFTVVARAGIEPATFHFSGGRSYRLSYLASTAARSVWWNRAKLRPRRDLNPRPPP